ncbi:MAG TPA: retropepsin-like aspartic protease [Thermoanaerobaculia bacterium]
MKVLRLAVAACLTLSVAASAQEPQPIRRREAPRAYAAVEVPAAAVEVPMLDGPLAVVEVRIDGQGPFRFGIDTGAAGGGRIDQKVVEKLKLPVAGQAMAGDPSGKNRRSVDIIRIGKLSVGEAVFRDVNATAGDYSDLGIDGILGVGLFSEHLLTLDYPRRKVRIERGELPPADGRRILGFEAQRGVPTIRLRVGEVEVDAHIDSGNTRSEIVVPASLAGQLKLAAEPVSIGTARTGFNQFEVRQAPLAGTLVLGSYELPNPKIDIVDLFPHANLGHKFLQRFAVTLDGKGRRIRFEPAS